MALEINAQFKQFVQFARQQANPATSEAIARVTGTEDALAGRSISTSNTDHVRGVFNWSGRSDTDAARNNETRALFRKAVADIFGGEGKIPKTVRDAMRLKDYGTPERPLGKPLTARRLAREFACGRDRRALRHACREVRQAGLAGRNRPGSRNKRSGRAVATRPSAPRRGGSDVAPASISRRRDFPRQFRAPVVESVAHPATRRACFLAGRGYNRPSFRPCAATS